MPKQSKKHARPAAGKGKGAAKSAPKAAGGDAGAGGGSVDAAALSVTQASLRGSGRLMSTWPASVSTSRPSTSTCTAVMAGRFVVRAWTMV